MQHEERFSAAKRAAYLGIWGNLGLALLKFFAGIVGKSQAVIADAVNTLADIFTDIITIFSLKVAKKPVDTEHPYTHGKAEAISALLVGLFIIGTGIFIFSAAVRSIIIRSFAKPELIALLAALLTVLVKEGMFSYVYKIGRKLNSPAILAKAKDHRSDILASLSVLIGVSVARLGFPFFDPMAAGIVSLFIVRIGYLTSFHAFHQLMDTLPDETILKEITKVAEKVKGVEHANEVRARYAGQFLLVDIKVDIDPKITVEEGHTIAKEVKLKVLEKISEVVDVMVHVNPHLH
ncbi:MAG: cation diffusion facilitator family transporter [Candidatus Subteraquimicrobiales bacterium]|nr:cation diffusion facilitator family transporter [Candidatus Subteraquimicrobiales bacterium]